MRRKRTHVASSLSKETYRRPSFTGKTKTGYCDLFASREDVGAGGTKCQSRDFSTSEGYLRTMATQLPLHVSSFDWRARRVPPSGPIRERRGVRGGVTVLGLEKGQEYGSCMYVDFSDGCCFGMDLADDEICGFQRSCVGVVG
ncbi:hypothetical protein B296_00034204 [Ensete ventricosum]|uniref:Uncharacterized protein n=1 Tax=Ensete ventricosum TaxID=4639 RepID=A0A427A7N3_ENSVE|nr:hypothetical protein B296_00034204 [Ensete ventricosum]